MWWENNKKIIIGIIIGIVIALIFIFTIPFVVRYVSDWGSNELLAAFTLIGVVVAFFIPFFDRKFKKKQEINRRDYENSVLLATRQYEETKKEESLKFLYRIDIHVTTLSKNTVLFSASIENVGDKTITPEVSNLYIDQGIELGKGSKIKIGRTETIGAIYYDFPFILQHNIQEGRPDCILCTKCKNNDLNYPEDSIDARFKQESKKLYRTNIELEHLSSKSIKYIRPKEKFSEDVVMQFKNSGVYRVTFIVTTDGEADCQCATKQFFVPNSLISEVENKTKEAK